MIMRSLLRLTGAVILAFLVSIFSVTMSQACDSANQTSTDLLAPVDYWGFRPPPKGQSYDDPVFCTTITTITDHHGQWTWNGELARFNSDDSLLLQCYHDVNGNQAIWLFDGTTGEKVKEIPLTDADRFRWSHDPDIFYYVDGNAIHTYNVQTQQDQVLYRFTEYTSVGLAGGDGNDLSDDYRWCVLDGEDKELFTFDLINKQKGTVWPIPTGGRPGGKSSGDIDYATISPSGQYVIVHWINDSSTERYHGTELYDRDWNFRRQIVAYDQHCELGYDPSGEEIYITTPSFDTKDWNASWGVNPADVIAVRFSDGHVTKLLDGAKWNHNQMTTVSGVNNSYVYIAYMDRGFDPECTGEHGDCYWWRYYGEIVEVPLDGSLNVRRLAHHRARSAENSTNTHEDFYCQPEPFVNHAGTKLFFKSNMFMEPEPKGIYQYGNDLFMIDLRSDPVNPPDQSDADSDGMPNVWEVQYGLNSSDPSDAAMDPDGDGFTNLAEYEGETDPNDAKVHPYLVVCGLGESASGWSEALYGDYSQKSWLRVGWSTYNEANGEARVATGDIDGDGKDEVILGLGPVSGNSGVPGGWFEILDDDESRLGWGRVSWSTYNSENGETWPACGDVDGDGVDEIVIGFGSGGAGWFEVFEYGSGTVSHKAWVRVRWSAYGTSDGAVRPACGDVDSDGRDEIVVGLGSSGSGWFEVFDDGEAGYADLGWQRVLWNEYNGMNGETRPACGDIDGDGVDEVIVGLGSSGAGWVEVFEYGGQGLVHRDWVRVRYQSYNDANGETRPVCGDLDGDGRDEVVVGLGQGGGGYVAVCDDASQGYGHLAWARVHWQVHNTNNGETWPGVKK